MNYILGINLPIKSRTHESGIALIDENGKIIFAANEERYSRKKLDGDFPEKSIKKMLEFTGVKREEIKYIALPTLTNWQKIVRFSEFIWREKRAKIFKFSTYKTIWKMIVAERNTSKIVNQEQEDFNIKYYWRDFIRNNFPNAKIIKVDHHLAHAGGAYFTSPWRHALILTLDGAGNLLTSVVAEGKNGQIKIIDKTFLPHSVGTFWGSITKVCGFKSGTRHGGKVTGLAAFGDYKRLIDKFRAIIKCEGLRIKAKEDLFFDPDILIPSWSSYEPQRMKNYIEEESREDIAAAAQKRLEEVVLNLVENAREKVESDKIVLAGGVFANVLLNQKILELNEIDDIYVFPAMSDGGLALGAALYALAKIKRKNSSELLPKALEDVYLGTKYLEKEVENILTENKIKYKKMDDPAKDLAKLIYNNKVVGFFSGRMEYGPRALGSRSIIYAPIDPSVNDWLNKKLNRSEFMPFAPVTMLEHIKDNYIGVAPDPLAAKYMTITYHCTDKMKKDAPACVHIDGTARPQVIKRDDNPYYYDVVSEYYKLSGIPTIINTSFNMHEEPIVESPNDAIRAFFEAELDYLALGDFLCSFEENKHLKQQI